MARPIPKNDFASVGKILPPGLRYLLAFVIIIFLLLLLVGALAIPFLFESPTMWYKFGIEKISLRTGKMLGIMAGLLLFLQLPLAARLNALDRIFSMPGLLRQHRIHAGVIALMAIIHPACVLLPEGTLIVPLDMRYWPEWVGVGLMVIILIQFVCSRWRQSLGLAFHRWMPFHRIVGLLTVILMVVHVLYVSESFTDHGPPRLAVLVAAGVFCGLWLWVRSGWLRVSRRPYVVSHVQPAGADSTCVEIMPSAKQSFAYLPGQFVMVSFQCNRISSEPHAFTLSSTPSRPGMLQFTIRACGDWTRDASKLQPGDRVLVQGPFGRFGHLFAGRNRALIMIAGGIGITPMLSMLRFMADRSDPRPITLIWSNRSNAHVVFADEMDVLAAKLTGLRRIPIFTRDTGNGKRSGRLDRRSLEILLDQCSRGSAVFICGPPRMMTQVKTDLKTLGFPAHWIFTEVFGF